MPIDAMLLIGPTGAGKSPLGEQLQQHGLGGKCCHHFDFGSQLRAVAAAEAPPAGFTGAEHFFIRDMLEKALLLEKEHFQLAEKIIAAFLKVRQYEQGDLIVLNGLPRHLEQAKDMDRVVAVGMVVVLDCPPEAVHARIRGNAGGDRTGRDDDGQRLIDKKLRIFRERTEPLIEHYRSAGSTVIRLNVAAETSAAQAYRDLLVLVRPEAPG